MTSNKKQRTTLFLTADIAVHAKAQALLERISLTNLVEKALIEYLPAETVVKKPKIFINNKSDVKTLRR